MTTIFITRTLAGAPADATTVKLRDSGGTYGIKRNSDSVVVVTPTAAIPSTATGDYEYDVSSLSVGNYTASWEVTVGTSVRYFLQVFNVESVTSSLSGVYLKDIEQEAARILGPFDDMEVAASSSNTVTTAYIPELVSTIGYGGIEDRYMLRRGLKSDGTRIAGFVSGDRVRQAASVDTSAGIATADRPWTNPPISTEIIEFHHLHPQRELRKAVISGLSRCYFWDRVSILTTSASQEVNLTALMPYLVDPDLIHRVEYQNISDTIYSPRAVRDWRPFTVSGQVYLRLSNNFYPQNIFVTILRPANTFINGVTSLQGPDDDDDLLAVPLEYARAAAHVEAWRYFTRKLFPVAQTGLFPTRAQAAAEFTMQSQGVFHSQSEPDIPKLEWDTVSYQGSY